MDGGRPLDAKSITDKNHPQTTLEIPTRHPDDREQCASCGKLMTPTLAFVNGTPHQSFCPFCGQVYRDFRKPSGTTFTGVAAEAAVTGILGSIIGSFFGH